MRDSGLQGPWGRLFPRMAPSLGLVGRAQLSAVECGTGQGSSGQVTSHARGLPLRKDSESLAQCLRPGCSLEAQHPELFLQGNTGAGPSAAPGCPMPSWSAWTGSGRLGLGRGLYSMYRAALWAQNKQRYLKPTGTEQARPPRAWRATIRLKFSRPPDSSGSSCLHRNYVMLP